MAQGRAQQGWSALSALFALAALTLLGGHAAIASAGSALQPDGGRPDSAVATLRVETKPPGLLVLIDGVKVGRSPVGPIWVAAKPILIQAVADDPRRFEPGRDTLLVTPRPGEARAVVLDVRPSVLLRSVPQPASLYAVDPRDSALGETPLRLLPASLEGRRFRLVAAEHADSSLVGDQLLALASPGAPVTIALHRIVPHRPPETPRGPPLIRRRWFQLALIGAGAALTGTSALLRHQGDLWYERYLAASDPGEIPRLYDRAAHYDRLAGASLGSGQVLLTSGVFLLVTSSSR